MRIRVLLAVAIAILALAGSDGTTRATGGVDAGADSFQTLDRGVAPSGTEEPSWIRLTTFSSGKLPGRPAGYFGANCDPFVGIILLQGQPLDSSTMGNTDTVVRRLADAPFPSPPGGLVSVPTEMVALSLVSVDPITVNCLGPQEWDVQVTLDAASSPGNGQMDIFHEDVDGGTATLLIHVCFQLDFVKVSDPSETRTMLPCQEGKGPVVLIGRDMPWTHDGCQPEAEGRGGSNFCIAENANVPIQGFDGSLLVTGTTVQDTGPLTGTVIIKKVKDPPSDLGTFGFTHNMEVNGEFLINIGEEKRFEVTPGSYEVTESGGDPGWVVLKFECVYSTGGIVFGTSRQANFPVDAGQTVTCTFTNENDSDGDRVGDSTDACPDTDLGEGDVNIDGCSANQFNGPGATVIIIKETVPAGSPKLFRFEHNIFPHNIGDDRPDAESFDLSDGEVQRFEVPPGNYHVEEDPDTELRFKMVKWVCFDPERSEGTSLKAEFTVGSGERVICTFTNKQVEANIIELELVASGLNSPLAVTNASDGSGRLFIVDQTGPIRIVEGGVLLPTPFLDLTNEIPVLNPSFDERGLLGLAFHPDYASNGRFFVRYSAPRDGISGEPCFGTSRGCHEEILSEYSVSDDNPNVAKPNGTIMFRISEPQFNHNGGDVAFGPDGLLYFTLGDGGGANDGLADSPPSHGPIGNGQNIDTVLGAILRIDVDAVPQSPLPYAIPSDNPFANQPGADEIYAFGLRNPYRFSFDNGPGGDGSLYLGDVGQDLFEEVDIIESSGNYGWVTREGRHCFDPFNPQNPPGGCATTGVSGESLIDPVAEYRHDEGGIAVVGGFVYRGSASPVLDGKYIFGDFSREISEPNGTIYFLNMDLASDNQSSNSDPNFQIWQFQIGINDVPYGLFLKGFGEDEDGEIYVTGSTMLGPFGGTGTVQRIVGVVCGDVHPAGGGDGDDDIQDALRKLKIAVGLVTPNEREKMIGDVHPVNDTGPDGDGDIDVLDALRDLKAAVGLVEIITCGGSG